MPWVSHLFLMSRNKNNGPKENFIVDIKTNCSITSTVGEYVFMIIRHDYRGWVFLPFNQCPLMLSGAGIGYTAIFFFFFLCFLCWTSFRLYTRESGSSWCSSTLYLKLRFLPSIGWSLCLFPFNFFLLYFTLSTGGPGELLPRINWSLPSM